MITWTPKELLPKIIEHFKKEDIIYSVCIEKANSKEAKTRQQEKTYYKLFTDIWNHLWEKPEDVKQMLLWWVFGTKEVKIWKITRDINIKTKTSELTKEEAIQFIDTILAFVKKYDMPITIESREFKSLIDNY